MSNQHDRSPSEDRSLSFDNLGPELHQHPKSDKLDRSTQRPRCPRPHREAVARRVAKEVQSTPRHGGLPVRGRASLMSDTPCVRDLEGEAEKAEQLVEYEKDIEEVEDALVMMESDEEAAQQRVRDNLSLWLDN